MNDAMHESAAAATQAESGAQPSGRQTQAASAAQTEPLTGRWARSSLRRRLTLTLCGIALAACAVFGLCAFITYQLTITSVLTWHMEPIMRMLVRAKESGSPPQDLHALARSLRVTWYTNEDIPPDMRPSEGGQQLTRARGGLYIFVSRGPDGRCYALTGKVTDLDEVEAAMVKVGVGCALVSLLAALLVSFSLSRRLVMPLVQLTSGIREGRPMADSHLLQRADETGELARAFAARERSLKAFIEREQLFTGDVSHELRTPLTVLKGAVEILDARVDDPSLQSVVARMDRTIDTMTITVRTMLLLARSPELLENRPFDMSALVRAHADRVQELLQGREVACTMNLPERLELRGSAELAALVLGNLLDNACRYTQAGSIAVHLDAASLVVKDTSPPIDEDLRRRMFERGVRGPGKAPGSGLGLSLVQRGCERLGWSVSHAVWEQGNCFTVRFEPQARDSADLRACNRPGAG